MLWLARTSWMLLEEMSQRSDVGRALLFKCSSGLEGYIDFRHYGITIT